MAEGDPYDKAAAAVRRAVGWATGGGRPVVLMVWAFNSALFLAAQWLFAVRVGFRPEEIGISPAESVAHAAVGLVVVLLSMTSLVLVVAGLNHVVALLTAFTWELVVLSGHAGIKRLLAAAGVLGATGAVDVLLVARIDGRAVAWSTAAATGVSLVVAWLLLGGPGRDEPFPVTPRWEVSWLGGMLSATLIIATAAYLDITDKLRTTSTVAVGAGWLFGTLVIAVTLALLSSGRPPRFARWLPARDKPSVTAVASVLLAAIVVGSWTISSAVHDARILRQGHIPSGIGRFIIGIPVQCVNVTWLHDQQAADIDRPLVRLGADATTLLYDPRHGLMRLPTSAVQTTGREATDCAD